jgi:hypothetical protein
MAIDVHFGDKLIPGLQIAIGIRTKDKPTVKLRCLRSDGGGAADLPHNLTRLDTELWKVRFKLPQEAKGEVELDVKAGADSKTEKKAIG